MLKTATLQSTLVGVDPALVGAMNMTPLPIDESSPYYSVDNFLLNRAAMMLVLLIAPRLKEIRALRTKALTDISRRLSLEGMETNIQQFIEYGKKYFRHVILYCLDDQMKAFSAWRAQMGEDFRRHGLEITIGPEVLYHDVFSKLDAAMDLTLKGLNAYMQDISTITEDTVIAGIRVLSRDINLLRDNNFAEYLFALNINCAEQLLNKIGNKSLTLDDMQFLVSLGVLSEMQSTDLFHHAQRTSITLEMLGQMLRSIFTSAESDAVKDTSAGKVLWGSSMHLFTAKPEVGAHPRIEELNDSDDEDLVVRQVPVYGA